MPFASTPGASRQPPAGWSTVSSGRTILVVARTTAVLTRLLDVLSLTQADSRIQTIFTTDAANPAVFGSGVAGMLDRLGARVVDWEEARRARIDLVLSASENDRLDQVKAPVLLVPHGASRQKLYPGGDIVSGMNPARLIVEGRVVPAVIALSHARERSLLVAACPPAADRTVVIGDPCLDRMLASRHREAAYLARFGAVGKKLVVLSSTWGPDSLWGLWPQLPEQLVAELPADEYRVVVIAHPGVWSIHGPWQVRSWLSRAQACGLRVISPEASWQPALLASSLVVSDHGSVSVYAAALGKPLLLATGPSSTTVAGSAVAALATRVQRLRPDRDLRAQITAACPADQPDQPDLRNLMAELAIERPGEGAQRLRPLLYRLLNLSEPDEEPAFPPHDLPVTDHIEVGAWVVGAESSPEVVALTRFPDLRRGRPHEHLDHRHVVADLAHATAAQLYGATIVSTSLRVWAQPWSAVANALLDEWPNAGMVTTTPDARTCLIRTRDQAVTLRFAAHTPGAEPLLLASLAQVRIAEAGHARYGQDRLRVGDRIIEVEAVAG